MELPLWGGWMALKMLTPGLLGMRGVITEWRTSNKTISKADNSAENCPVGWRCTPWRHLYFLSQRGKMLQILANGTFLLLVFSFCSQTHLRSAQGRTYCGTLGLQNPPLCWSHHCSPLHPPPEPHQGHTLQFCFHIPDPLGHRQTDKTVFSRPLLCLPGASDSLSMAHACYTRRKINNSTEENSLHAGAARS